MGTIASILHNVYRAKGQRTLTAEDFNPFKPRLTKVRAKTSDDLLKKVEMLNFMFGGKDLRHGTGR